MGKRRNTTSKPTSRSEKAAGTSRSRTTKGPTARTTKPRTTRVRKTPTLTPTPPGDGSAATSRSFVTPNDEQIAKRAYEIWLAKGRPVGQDEQNWREAEAELISAAQ